MNALEQEILQTLVQMETAVAQLRTGGPKPSLLPILNRLDELTTQLPRGTDPNLLHYMHKKSYEKARLLLQGRNEENERGSCDRS